MKHRIKTKKIPVRFRGKTLFTVLLGIFVVIQILLALKTSSSGAILVELEGKEKNLIAEKQRLAEELVSTTSLLGISQKAQELGFSTPQNTIYLKVDDAVAKLP